MSDQSLTKTVKSGDIGAAGEQLASGADIHERSEQNWTPLNWAAGAGDLPMVRLLVDHGADIFLTGTDQRTPYLISLAAGRVEVARYIRELEIERGTPEQIGNSSGQQRAYCSAYRLDQLRTFAGWIDCNGPRELRDATESMAAQGSLGEPQTDSDQELQDIVFIHQDFTVTASMWHGEDVIFDQITPEWITFCKTQLKFEVPDDLDLIANGQPD